MKAHLELTSTAGATAVLWIRTLPNQHEWRGNPTLICEEATDQPAVQLLEESEYEYELQCEGAAAPRRIEPAEVFSASSRNTAVGRLRTRTRTGIVRIDLELASGELLSGEIQVRSRKLDYKTEYRWMLERIADEASALALSPFAASRLSSLTDDQSGSAKTLYQRFEFLRAQLDSEELAAAIDQLRYRPHTSLEDQVESVPTTRPIRGGGGLGRQLTRPGQRRRLDEPIGHLTSLPVVIDRKAHVDTFDTVPNRFVRWVVQDWVALVEMVQMAMAGEGDTRELPRRERGRRETQAVLDRLEELLRIPAIRSAGRLESLPVSNTVVRNRSGYREFLSAYQTSNANAFLRWDVQEDHRSAGQHDVATLYEYWVFLEIVRIVESIPGFTVDRSDLFEVAGNQLSLELRKSKECLVTCSGKEGDQEVQLEVWFNRSFTHRPAVGHDGSWSVLMRPDVSIGISLRAEDGATEATTWLHFDAKYKVKTYTQSFANEDSEAEVSGKVVPADVQKMHAYRDAIRRSAGAYVIYPGTEQLGWQQYHELLPGLGAFCLRPSSGGEADSESARSVRSFISDVIQHIAAGGTNLDRDRYWTDLVHGNKPTPAARRPFLEKPQADTTVLVGFVRSAEHWAAIEELEQYNLRADPSRSGAVGIDSDLLGADLVVLYGSAGPAQVFETTARTALMRKQELRLCGYEPSGDLYLCVGIRAPAVVDLDGDAIRRLARGKTATLGAPVGMTWYELEHEARAQADD